MKKKLDQETGGALNNQKPVELNREQFTFMPTKAKPVPDFKRLQKTFQQNLEDVKKQK